MNPCLGFLLIVLRQRNRWAAGTLLGIHLIFDGWAEIAFALAARSGKAGPSGDVSELSSKS
jgi:uncharacterized membrane protein HdeD (DUF308 family)